MLTSPPMRLHTLSTAFATSAEDRDQISNGTFARLLGPRVRRGRPQFLWPEHNLSFNPRRGTLRGLHYQRPPHEEIKLVRCVAGAIHDVAVDLRPGSPTHGRCEAFELSAENGRALYIPVGCAHGFQTLVDNSRVSYLMSATYDAASAAGIRHDDPALGIACPIAEKIVSARDGALPRLGPFAEPWIR